MSHSNSRSIVAVLLLGSITAAFAVLAPTQLLAAESDSRLSSGTQQGSAAAEDEIKVDFRAIEYSSGGLQFGQLGQHRIQLKVWLIPDRRIGEGEFLNTAVLSDKAVGSALSPEGVFYWNPLTDRGLANERRPRQLFLVKDLGIEEFLEDKDVALILGPDAITSWPEVYRLVLNSDGYLGGSSSDPLIGVGFTFVMQQKPTEEQARGIARGIIRIIEEAVRLPIQAELKQQQLELEAALAEIDPQLEALRESREATQKAFLASDQLSEATVNQLRAEDKLLDVEFVGAQATVQKCEEILAARRARGNALGKESQNLTLQIEGMKLEAEIQLASLAARKKLFDEVISEARLREELDSIRNSARQVGGERDRLIEQLRVVKEQQNLFVPLRLLENTVQVDFPAPSEETDGGK